MAFTSPVDVEQLFRVADADRDGVVNVQDALAFFGGALLPPSAMNAIWAAAVTSRGASALTRENFPLALALLALAQQGRPPTLDTLAATSSPLPPPLLLTASANDRSKYDMLFEQSCDIRSGPHAPAVSGAKAREVLGVWPVPLPVLGRIWELADADRDGALTRTEFGIAMALTCHAAQGKELPPVVPSTLLASLKQPDQPQLSPRTASVPAPALSTDQAERLRGATAAERGAAEQAESALKAESARGAAIAEQINALSVEAETIRTRVAAARAQVAAARSRNAELVLDKRHREEELVQLRKQADEDAAALEELEDQLAKSVADAQRVQDEARKVETEAAKLRATREATMERLTGAVRSLSEAAQALAKQRRALEEETRLSLAAQQQEAASAAAATSATAEWPRGTAFGPDFVVPNGVVDAKISPFAVDDEQADSIPCANVWVYEPFK